MQTSRERKAPAVSPGTWSTDEYIRRWAKSQGMNGECCVPLQSLHDEWCAKIHFDRAGHPVERRKCVAEKNAHRPELVSIPEC